MGCTYWNFPETNDDWIVDGTGVYSHKPLLNINRVIRLEIVFRGFKDFVMFIFNIQGLIIIAYSNCFIFLNIERHLADGSIGTDDGKRGCVIPMVIWPAFRMEQYIVRPSLPCTLVYRKRFIEIKIVPRKRIRNESLIKFGIRHINLNLGTIL